MSAVNTIETELSNLVQLVVDDLKAKGLNQIDHDEQWPSPCEYQEGGKNLWQAVLQDPKQSFDNVESGLNVKLDSQFKALFCHFYSNNLDVQHEKGQLQILQPWSQQDFERLQQNLIGHLMMKAKLKQTPTLFFALTDEEDLNLVVNNLTGEVALEYVGKEPHQIVAKDLQRFLSDCKV